MSREMTLSRLLTFEPLLNHLCRLGLVQREESLTRNETGGDRYVPDGVREWVIRALMMLVTIHESLRCIGEDVRDRILSKVVEKLWWTCVDFVSEVGSGKLLLNIHFPCSSFIPSTSRLLQRLDGLSLTTVSV